MEFPWIALTILFSLTIAIAIASANAVAFNVTAISYGDRYMPLFGEHNILPSKDGQTVRILLNQKSGSGFISSDLYYHGLFSASIRLPSDHTAGVVVAFYMSNGDIFEKNHDELDFEFLGNVRGREWRVQTNLYGNGSTDRGREERYSLPFDPTAEAHRYSILWTNTTIIFYIDDVPIREVVRSEGMGGDYPSKPMLVYATIWDGSTWATSGGKHRINYKYAPFASDFSDLVLSGCRLDPVHRLPADEQCAEPEAVRFASDFTAQMRQDMLRFRQRFMTYSFCYDQLRYPTGFPDCQLVTAEKLNFDMSGHVSKPDVKDMPPRKSRSRRRARAGKRILDF